MSVKVIKSLEKGHKHMHRAEYNQLCYKFLHFVNTFHHSITTCKFSNYTDTNFVFQGTIDCDAAQ